MKRLVPVALAALLLAGFAPTAATPASIALSPLEAAEIQFTYQKLTSDFYQKVDAQQVLDGARTELTKALDASGVHKTLPRLVASTNAMTNVRAVDQAVDSASRIAGTKVQPHLLSYAAISGMLHAVNDKYTVFLSPKEYAALNQGLDGEKFSGTGIVIGVDDKTKEITVNNVVPNGPADRAGVQQDDLIDSIDGISTKNMTIEQASSHLRGKEGTKVSLAIARDGKALTAPVVVTREQIREVSVFDRMLPNKIGYVALTVFGKDTGAELNTAIERLQQEGARAFVMDLRDNGGGYLEAAIEVSSKFIPSGPIVSVESRASNVTTIEADNTAIPPVPLAVLVNGHTASASEITSGAIQDSGVGTIIGTKTFGKGVVQTIYPLPDGSAVKITTARYFTPRNRDINHIGIAPDVTIDEPKGSRYGDPTRDEQLARALDLLNKKMAQSAPATPAGSGT